MARAGSTDTRESIAHRWAGWTHSAFAATTIFPGSYRPSRPVIERTRLLEMINLPVIARVTIIAAPAGFGKTTLALQWAPTYGHPVHVVHRRPLMDVTASDQGSPAPLGRHMAELLSRLGTGRNGDADQPERCPEIRATLDAINELPFASNEALVLDDLDLLQGDTDRRLMELLASRELNLPVGHIVLITRRVVGSEVSSFFHLGPIRVIGQEALALDPGELDQAVDAGVFPGLDKHRASRISRDVNGWIGGIRLLSGDDEDPSREPLFDQWVQNEIVLPLPPAAQQIIGANLPAFSAGLWERFMAIPDVSLPPIQSLLSQLPVELLDPLPNEPSRFTVPSALRAALSRLHAEWPQTPLDRTIRRIALEWYVEIGAWQDAAAVAQRNGMWAEYLTLISPPCALMIEESETSILGLTGMVPPSELACFPDLTYWTMRGYYLENRMVDARMLAEQIRSDWATSPDPLLRARMFILLAGRSMILGDPQQALALATASYDLLSPDHRAERLHASIVAERAARQIGHADLIATWAIRTNDAYPYQSPSSEGWWHRSVGRHRADDLAIKGRLSSAAHMLSLRIRELEGSPSPQVLFYLIALAYIDIERDDLAAAQEHLSQALLRGFPTGERFYHDIASARLLIAMGDRSAAACILLGIPNDPGRRVDQVFRLAMLRASIALSNGDADLAEVILESAPALPETWPQIFGDLNVRNLRAGIAWHRGDHVQALAWLDESIGEATRRDQPGFLVRPCVLKAAILSETGDHHGARDALDRALSIAEPGGFVRSLRVKGQHIRDYVDKELSGNNTADERPTRRVALTEREAEILRMAATGKGNRQIADDLYISLSTVKNHFANIYAKMGVNRRQHAVDVARRLGML